MANIRTLPQGVKPFGIEMREAVFVASPLSQLETEGRIRVEVRMKKKIVIATVFLLVVSALWAVDIERALRTAMDELAGKYSATREELYSKKTVTIVSIKNLSESAAKNYIGEGVAEILKLIIGDSLVFKYVDRELLEAALKEIELALTDITEESEVQVGNIENIGLLLTGSVIEEGDDFVINVQLVDVESTSLAAASKVSVPQAELIEESNRIAYEYIVANGIGLGIQLSPTKLLIFPASKVVDKGGDELALDFAAGLTYRLSRNWKFSLSYDMKVHDIFADERLYRELENIPDTDFAVDSDLWMTDGTLAGSDEITRELISKSEVSYFVSQWLTSISLMGSYVVPFGQRFSFSFGAGPAYNRVKYEQKYSGIPVSAPGDGGPAVRMARKVIESTFNGAGVGLNAEAEYFFLPRFALNAGLTYRYVKIFPSKKMSALDTSSGVFFYTRDDRAIDAFGLDPFQLPNGTELSNEAFSGSYFKIYTGISIYF